METPVHQESQTMGKWFPFLMACVFALMVVVAITSPRKETAWLLAAVLLILVVFFGMRTMKVVVTPTELRFGFAFWRKRLPLNDVEVLGVENIPLAAGIGIHFYPGKWVYNARLGQGVHLVYEGKKHYLIGSNNPEALFSALKTATTPHQWERELTAHQSG